ncbi:uncharacterized protein LOC114437615 isoform X2 [Parambassis ranga]|uniref:Uncharacterized protein LOC114437615 isoform X2 n=1 Tax=Parambassis ranga TaxID=210632 RepID=A0A6P7I7V4_9TELE|nr:uncharacterized protein LOC114437615 isoform X2 [Parambassis ranga]
MCHLSVCFWIQGSSMESSDQDVVTLQAVRDLPIVGLNTEVSPGPEPEQDQSEQDVQPETNQEVPEPGRCPQSLALIEFRIQQLQNRRFLLLKMQNFIQKTGQSISSETSEDSDELCELDAVQKELEELLLKKEELEKQEGSSNHTANGDHQEHSDLYKCETPHGGVYMLPPLQVHREGQTQPPTGPILPGVEPTSSLYTTNMSECIQAFSLSLSFFW